MQGGSILALHGRKPAVHIQPPTSGSSQLLASSVPATPVSPCNISSCAPRRKTNALLLESLSSGTSDPEVGTRPAASGAAQAHAQKDQVSVSRVEMPDLHTLSTHCSRDAGQQEEEQPQLRRSQRKRTGVKLL